MIFYLKCAAYKSTYFLTYLITKCVYWCVVDKTVVEWCDNAYFISPGSGETKVRWDGDWNHRFKSTFFMNIIKIGKHRGFFDTQRRRDNYCSNSWALGYSALKLVKTQSHPLSDTSARRISRSSFSLLQFPVEIIWALLPSSRPWFSVFVPRSVADAIPKIRNELPRTLTLLFRYHLKATYFIQKMVLLSGFILIFRKKVFHDVQMRRLKLVCTAAYCKSFQFVWQ